MKKAKFLNDVEKFIFEYFKENQTGMYTYHNFSHTLEVVENARKIAKQAELEGEEKENVLVAAWFHDVGYRGDGANHEEQGAKIAAKYLTEQEIPIEKIQEIQRLILATKIDTEPTDLLEEIIRDADSMHVGKKAYFDKSDLLRSEWEATKRASYTELEWRENQLEFLISHRFYTPFAHVKYSSGKSDNITKVRKLLFELNQVKRKQEKADKLLKEKNKAKKEKESKPDRGIETMFRIVSRTHMDLSGMADNKANIMLSINAIIISISVSVLIPSFDENPYLILPSTLLIAVCISTIVFAVLSTRPKISGGTFTKEDIAKHKVNLLFFGNFYNMTLPDFEAGMLEMLGDRDFLYSSMIKDFYFLGIVLARKYKLVRIAYNIFMFGLIASLLAFAVAFYLWDKDGGGY